MNGTYFNGNTVYETNRLTNFDNNITEQSYIENILRNNKGKLVTVFTSFPTDQGQSVTSFKGYIKEAGRDNLVLKSSEKEEYYLILMIYVDYVTFYEPITYKK